MRRLTKRLFRIALYFALAVIALSIGLRIYSAWQIPKAKRLLRDFQQLRVSQPEDQRLRDFLQGYNFERSSESSDDLGQFEFYQAAFGNFPRITKIHQKAEWLANHGGRWLGFRPWTIGVSLMIREHKLSYASFSFQLQDGSELGTGGGVGVDSRLPIGHEALPNYRISAWRRDHFISAHFTPEASPEMVRSAMEIDYSCIWGLRVCRTSEEVFPKLNSLFDLQGQALQAYTRLTNPCPIANMYARVRDGGDVAFGTITNVKRTPHSDEISTMIRVGEFLQHDPRPGRVQRIEPGTEEIPWNYIDRRLFPHPPSVGDRVLLFAKSDPTCDVLPASPQNVQAAQQAALKARDVPQN